MNDVLSSRLRELRLTATLLERLCKQGPVPSLLLGRVLLAADHAAANLASLAATIEAAQRETVHD